MKRRTTLLAVLSLFVAGTLAISGCASAAASGSSSAGDITVAGTTRVDLVEVAAPAPSVSPIDVTVGIASLQTPQAIAARRRAASAKTPARGQAPAGMLTAVNVRPGDTVKKGQILAQLDDRLLRVALDNAEAASRRAVAGADTLKANASTLRDQRATVRDARSQLLTQQSLLNSQSGQVSAKLDQVNGQIAAANGQLGQDNARRAYLVAQLAAAQRQAASPKPPADIKDTIASLNSQLADVGKDIGKTQAMLGMLNAALPQLEAAMAKMGQGAAQMSAAKAKIATALSKMSDGIDQLDQASSTAKIASAAQAAAIESAKAALDAATLRSPADGVVVSALPAGQVAMVGAPVVVIRPKTDVLVDVYLAPDQATRVRAGDPAEVTLDSLPAPVKGSVNTVWPGVQFPPNNYPTPIVHLADAVRVTVSVPQQNLPLGVPVDVVIHPTR